MTRSALITSIFASAAALGSAWIPEPLDIAAVGVAAVLGAISVVLFCAGRVSLEERPAKKTTPRV